MSKRKPRCVICGRKRGTRTIKLPHGSINLCHDSRCTKSLNYKIDQSVALLWFSMDDMRDRETLAPEILNSFDNEKDMMTLADNMEDQLLGDMFWDSWSGAVDQVGVELEQQYVKNLKDPHMHLDVPLKHAASKLLLEKRLKGET